MQIPLLQAGGQQAGKDAWSSTDGVEKVLKEVSYILTHPNLAIAVNKEASVRSCSSCLTTLFFSVVLVPMGSYLPREECMN